MIIPSEDSRIRQYAHWETCNGILNFEPVSKIHLGLKPLVSAASPELLNAHIKSSLIKLLEDGHISFFITEDSETRDLSFEEALHELENPLCWKLGGRYLAAGRVRETSYFASIEAYLREYLELFRDIRRK